MTPSDRLKARSSARLGLVFAAVLVFVAGLSAQTPERFFDTAAAPQKQIRLTIFYPTVGSIKALLSLKDQGLIPYDNLEVVGVHHAKERFDYQESIKFVRENKIDWIKFHTVTTELGLDTIYKKNAASDEFRKIFDLSNGIVFFGGPDIPPAFYGQKTVITDPYRHYLEISMIFHLLGGSQDAGAKGFLEKRPDFPVLGICLGMQSLNVATGGTLIQDIWTETYGQSRVEDIIALGQLKWHNNPHPRIAPLDRSLITYNIHPVKISAGSRFWTALGLNPADQPYIMSSHHQAADKLGQGFKTVAASPDGKVVEAIEHEKFPNVIGLQFHPEFPIIWDATPKYKFAPEDRDLFGCRTILEAHPPSLEFHKRFWLWFFAKVKGPTK
jgi:putative glutamine amidotransferase